MVTVVLSKLIIILTLLMPVDCIDVSELSECETLIETTCSPPSS